MKYEVFMNALKTYFPMSKKHLVFAFIIVSAMQTFAQQDPQYSQYMEVKKPSVHRLLLEVNGLVLMELQKRKPFLFMVL